MITVLATGARAELREGLVHAATSFYSSGRTLASLSRDPYYFLGTLMRGRRLIAVCVGITLVVLAIYLARIKPVYQASARLLVLQHGGQPLYGRQWRSPVTTLCSSPWTGILTRSQPTS